MTLEEKVFRIALELDPHAQLMTRQDDIDPFVHIQFSNGALGRAPRLWDESEIGREEVIKWLQIALPPWSLEWPTEPGSYWFYGWLFMSPAHSSPDFHFGIIKSTMFGFIFDIEGRQFYKSDGVKGHWLKAKLPQKPVLEKP